MLLLPAGCEPGPRDFRSVEHLSVPMEWETSVVGVVGMHLSTSVHVAYMERHGQAAGDKLMEQYRQDLLAACGIGEEDEHAPLLRWESDVQLILAREPLLL